MPLKVDGVQLDLDKPSISVMKVKEFLDKAPQDELYTTARLQQLSRIGKNSVIAFSRRFPAYRHYLGSARILHYGHPKAVEALQKEIKRHLAGGQ